MMLKLLVLAATSIGMIAAADFTGKWTGTMETNGSRVRIFLTLTGPKLSQAAQETQRVSGTVATSGPVKALALACTGSAAVFRHLF